jgi:CRP/FNR family transcriptional regulator
MERILSAEGGRSEVAGAAAWRGTPHDGISAVDLPESAWLNGTRLRLRRNSRLFRSGDRFESLFGVRFGFLKSTAGTEDGREQVIGFHLKGDLVGFDGIATQQHCCELTALEGSELIVIPEASLLGSAPEAQPLREFIHRAMSQQLIRDQKALLLLGRFKAEQRVASFLLDLAQRFKARGYSRSEFVLRMTRAEIGSYLGVTLETVSRCLSRFALDGLIARRGRNIRIIDAAALEWLVDGGTAAPTTLKAPKAPARAGRSAVGARLVAGGISIV